jgi:hypothetical protein
MAKTFDSIQILYIVISCLVLSHNTLSMQLSQFNRVYYPSSRWRNNPVATTQKDEPNPCTAKNWMHYNEKCFFVSLDKLDWHSAKKKCESMDSNFVSFHSLDDIKDLKKAVKLVYLFSF